MDRRRQLDGYFTKERLGIPDDELSGLDALREDVDDMLARELADIGRIRRQLDGRRQLFIGHPLIRLSTHVRQATGGASYHDVQIENVLWDIRNARGFEQRAPGTLKKLRDR